MTSQKERMARARKVGCSAKTAHLFAAMKDRTTESSMETATALRTKGKFGRPQCPARAVGYVITAPDTGKHLPGGQAEMPPGSGMAVHGNASRGAPYVYAGSLSVSLSTQAAPPQSSTYTPTPAVVAERHRTSPRPSAADVPLTLDLVQHGNEVRRERGRVRRLLPDGGPADTRRARGRYEEVLRRGRRGVVGSQGRAV